MARGKIQLLKNGANPNALNNNKQSPLHLLIQNTEKKSTEVIMKGINLLAKFDLDCDTMDKFGNTPMWYAVYDGNVHFVNCLKNLHADWSTIKDEYGFSVDWLNSRTFHFPRECGKNSPFPAGSRGKMREML